MVSAEIEASQSTLLTVRRIFPFSPKERASVDTTPTSLGTQARRERDIHELSRNGSIFLADLLRDWPQLGLRHRPPEGFLGRTGREPGRVRIVKRRHLVSSEPPAYGPSELISTTWDKAPFVDGKDVIIIDNASFANGGEAHIHRGWLPNIGREVAVRLINLHQPLHESVSAAGNSARAEREAKLLDRIHHAETGPRHFPMIDDAFPTDIDGVQHIVQIIKYFPREMDQQILRQAPTAPANTINLPLYRNFVETWRGNAGLPLLLVGPTIQEAAVGLEHLHAQQIAHRDVKPTNLMTSYSKENPDPPSGLYAPVVFLDFGLSNVSYGRRALMMLQQQGTMVGTPGYMPYEGFIPTDKEFADYRATDIFALAATSFYLLFGTDVFPNFSTITANIRDRGQNCTVLSLMEEMYREKIQNLPLLGALQPVFMKAFAQWPRDRYQTAVAFSEAFCAALEAQMQSLQRAVHNPESEYQRWREAVRKKLAEIDQTFITPSHPDYVSHGQTRLLV